MMSYGSTAETSFSLVRTLVASDPAKLASIDAVLKARGFGKLVTGDTAVSQHPHARAEAISELKWLAEYLQNVRDRADKFAPHEKQGRSVIIDDEDNDPLEQGGANAASEQTDITKREAGRHNDAGVDADDVLQATGSNQGLNGSAPVSEPKEYDHTSEESDETSEEMEKSRSASAEPLETPLTQENISTQPIREHDKTPGTDAQFQGILRKNESSQPTEAFQAERARELQAEHESRQLKRQRHALEREHARKLQEQLRFEREQQKAEEERQRQLNNRRKLEEKRRRALEAATAASGATSDEEIWCLCREPAHGFMLACANPKCPYEWFHGSCVGLDTAPKARWFCPICRPSRTFTGLAVAVSSRNSKTSSDNKRSHGSRSRNRAASGGNRVVKKEADRPRRAESGRFLGNSDSRTPRERRPRRA